jgi:hypothetical protein
LQPGGHTYDGARQEQAGSPDAPGVPADTDGMPGRLYHIVVDAHDLPGLARFFLACSSLAIWPPCRIAAGKPDEPARTAGRCPARLPAGRTGPGFLSGFCATTACMNAYAAWSNPGSQAYWPTAKACAPRTAPVSSMTAPATRGKSVAWLTDYQLEPVVPRPPRAADLDPRDADRLELA